MTSKPGGRVIRAVFSAALSGMLIKGCVPVRVVVGALTVVALAGAAGCDGSDGGSGGGADGGSPAVSPTAAAAPTETGARGCAAPLRRPLPTWARAGFSGDATAIHVLGERGDIVAVLFGYPLRQPPEEGRNNKILWVSRVEHPGDALVVQAHLNGTGPAVRREVPGGPGPSIIDLPSAGCWKLDLTWSGNRDAVWLTYEG
jgi:hypothetical protein